MGIIKKLTTKIGELLSGEPATKPITKGGSEHDSEASVKQETAGEQVPVTEEKKPLPNSVETRGKIKKSTLTLLNSLYLVNPEICKTKHLIVWIDTDTITFNSYADFSQELENYWAVESGYSFEKVELKHGKPENEKNARKIDAGLGSIAIYLQEQEVGLEKTLSKEQTFLFLVAKEAYYKNNMNCQAKRLKRNAENTTISGVESIRT